MALVPMDQSVVPVAWVAVDQSVVPMAWVAVDQSVVPVAWVAVDQSVPCGSFVAWKFLCHRLRLEIGHIASRARISLCWSESPLTSYRGIFCPSPGCCVPPGFCPSACC